MVSTCAQCDVNSEITVDPFFLDIVDQENQVSMKYGVQTQLEMNEAEGTKEVGQPLREERKRRQRERPLRINPSPNSAFGGQIRVQKKLVV